MAISYLSRPLESTVKPFADNLELISKVASYKQSRYDKVVDTMLQKQNDLLNLDTLNEQVTSDKNNLLKIADQQLNELAKVDLLNPENINKAEAIFQPITSNKSIMEDVYYTKKIRENQEFAQQTLKKDPSIGNQKNFNTSQELVELYRKADKNNLSEVAAYTTMFAPYIDVKGKVSKLLTDLKILNPQEFKTTRDVQGVIQEYIKKGKITKDEVLQKVNAIFTPEDKYQLMLDGYGDYGKFDIKDVVGGMDFYQKNVIEIDKNIPKVNTQIEILDKNGDGEIDNLTGTEVDADKQELLNELYSQKRYLDQQKQTYSEALKYKEKFDKNGDLSTGDRLGLFQFFKQTEITNDITSLFESDYKNFEFKFDDSVLTKFNNDVELETYKSQLRREEDALKDKKGKSSAPGISIDYNIDGIPDLELPSNYSTQNQNLTETDLEDIYEVKDIKEGQRFNFNDGTSVAVDIGNTGIKDWESAFTKSMKGASIDGQKYIADNLGMLAVDSSGSVNPQMLTAVNAGYEFFKKSATKLENDKKPLIKDNFPELKGQEKNFEVYSQLYQFEKNFQSGNDLLSIKKTIESYLLNDLGYKEKIKNSTDAKFFTTMSKKFTPEDFKKIVNNNIYYTSNYREKEKLNSIYDKIKDIPISKNDKPIDIYNKYAEKLGMGKGNHHNLYITNEAFLTIEEKLLKNLSLDTFHYVEDLDPLKENAKRFHEEKQKMYKQLLSKFSPLVINYPTSMTTDAKMNDIFFARSENLLNSANVEDLMIKNNKGKWVKIEDEEKATYKAAINDGKNAITLQSYNTSTGELTAKIGGLAEVKYQVNQKTAMENGMPYGLNAKDIVGKNLIVQTMVDPEKPYSSLVSAGSFVLGEGVTQPANIYYDKQSGLFVLVSGDKHSSPVRKTAYSTTELLGFVQMQNASNQPTMINILNK